MDLSFIHECCASGKADASAVHDLDHNAFYMFHYKEVKEKCFHELPKEEYDLKMKTLKEEAYAVHLNSKITGNEGVKRLQNGTICQYLLNSFCVLCNNVY